MFTMGTFPEAAEEIAAAAAWSTDVPTQEGMGML